MFHDYFKEGFVTGDLYKDFFTIGERKSARMNELKIKDSEADFSQTYNIISGSIFEE